MAKRKQARRKEARPRIDPIAFRAEFLKVAARNSARHLKEISELLDTAPQASARGVLEYLGDLLGKGLHFLACKEAEQVLDDTTQLVRDNWGNMTQQQIDSIEKSMQGLLDTYSENC